MYRKGSDELAAGSAGNLSVRTGDIVAITPSGIPHADLRPADICLVAPAGSPQLRAAR
jgi:L-fuculose-phosphate aldolase